MNGFVETALANNQMARTIYAEINLHITWHTKGGARPLKGAIESQWHRHLRNRVMSSEGARCHAIGGTDDHVHLAVSIPPTLTVSDWIGELKGASAYYVNKKVANRKVLEWQSGYGVVGFGTKDLPWVIRYVENQREHHGAGTTHERLEPAEAGDRSPLKRAQSM